MSTKKQVSANRENAKKSTGPKTTEGKAKSSQNAIKHGLTACCNIIEIEDREEFDFFRNEMLDDLYPIGPMQYRLAERIVSLSWRLRRAEIMHDKTIDDLLQKDTDWLYYDIDQYRTHPDMPDNELALGHMAQSDFSGNRVLDRLIMYERRIENSMYKTIKELKKMQNEPNSKQPRPKADQINNQSSTCAQGIINNQLKGEPISSTTERQEPRYQPREVPEDNYEKLPISMPPEVEKIISRIRKNLKLDEIKEANIENKVSTIENPVSSIEKMKNEPNYTPPCHCEGANTYLPEGSDAAISTTPLHLASPMSSQESQKMQNKPNFTPPCHCEEQSDAAISTTPLHLASPISSQESQKMQNKPNFTPHTPKKPINNPRPKADSKNNQPVPKVSSIINNQLKGVIAKRNQGRSEAAHYPRRPIRARLNKK